jgi:hypothetical protein
MVAQSIERLPFGMVLIRARQRVTQASQPAKSESIERIEERQDASALTAPLYFAII